MPWESFRGDIEAAVLTPETERKSTAGRKPIDAMVLFRMLILQSLYNLSDEQVEYQVRDRLFVYAVPHIRYRGLHPRRHDVVAIPREARQGWRY